MNDFHHPPKILAAIEADTNAIEFTMASDHLTGSLLRTLAASKPAGNFLELGTGTGLATAWILEGIDSASKLQTVDQDEKLVDIAKKYLGDDPRIDFQVGAGEEFISELISQKQSFDLIFADTWPGKFFLLDEALSLVKPGGFYVVDDLLPQPSWPDGHAPKVDHLISTLEQNKNFRLTKLNWSTGLIIATKIHEPRARAQSNLPE